MAIELSQNKKLIQFGVSAILALIFVNFYLKSKEQTIESSYSMVTVLTASRDIPPHTALSPSMLSTKDMPALYVEPGAILVKYPGQEQERVKGKITVSAIPEGAQITQSNLGVPSPETSGVAPLLPPGKRG